jgi:ankyrin repeat protein
MNKYKIEDLPSYILNSEGIQQYIIDFPGDDFETNEELYILEVTEITNENIRKILNNIRYFGTNESDPIFYDIFCYLAVNDRSVLDDFPELRMFDRNYNFVLNNQSCKNAILIQNLFYLRYANENGFQFDTYDYNYAVFYDSLEIIKYLFEHGCPWNEEVFPVAVYNKNIEIIKYLHKNGCPWNESTFINAVSSGILENVKYLHKNGCPFYSDHSRLCLYAAKNGHLDCLKYLHENGFSLEGAYRSAAYNGHLECLKYSYENDNDDEHYFEPDIVKNKTDNFECLKYLVEHHCGIQAELISEVLDTGRIDYIKYLLEHGYDWE